jgi:3-oxoacyl-[acyl-carrier protein] reductase
MNGALELDGQVAIVTGASSDIGKAIALALAERGARLALVGRRVEALLPAAEVVQRARAVRCDVTHGADVVAMVHQVREAFGGRIDILVNVAGGTGGLDVPLWDISEQDFGDVLALNLTASFLTMKAVLPVMIEQRSGRIINIAGTFGLRGRAKRTAYSAAKWGLRGLTKSAALEAGPFNVTVNCVSPGVVKGPRLAEMGVDAAERVKEGLALRRVTTPNDVARMVCFLAGEGGRQVTGQDLVVDGGWAI